MDAQNGVDPGGGFFFCASLPPLVLLRNVEHPYPTCIFKNFGPMNLNSTRPSQLQFHGQVIGGLGLIKIIFPA